jgi:hypothetical protein
MNITLSHSQVKRLLIQHIEEECSTEDFAALIVQLIKLYKKFQGADLDELKELLK